MITLDEACNLAAQLTCPYLPGLQIDIGHSNHYKGNELLVSISFEVSLTHKPSAIKPLRSSVRFKNADVQTGYDFLIDVRDAMAFAVAHEIDENLRFDGMFVKDPHPGLYKYPVIDKEMFRFT